MRYQKNPTEAQIEDLIKALRFALKNGNEFLVIADLGHHAFNAGSGKLSLVEFIVRCMMADGRTAELFINVVMNYMSNRIMQDLCDKCDKASSCKEREDHCDPENLYSDLKAQLELALKLTKSGMN